MEYSMSSVLFRFHEVFKTQAPVVQQFDSAIRRINHYPVAGAHQMGSCQWITFKETNCHVHWIVIYQVDKTILRLCIF